MKIDIAIQSFTERYDRSAMESIDHVSKDLGLGYNKATVKVFNLSEAGQSFREILLGYSQYKTENIGKEDAISQDEIVQKVTEGIDPLFTEADVLYPDLPGFVTSYVTTVKTIQETVDQVQTSMLENGVDNKAVGAVTDLVDKFMEAFDSRFETAMNKILWASGYNSSQALKQKTPDTKTMRPVFL